MQYKITLFTIFGEYLRKMKEFLMSVASVMTENYSRLDDFIFVFPNKRSGTFFLKYLRSLMKERMVAPRIMTIPDFAEMLSGRVPDTRLDLLFSLFSEYRKIAGKDVARFDKFRAWGEMVLSDFNDIEMYEADASALYRNLANLREIRTDFLTDEQKEVLREYFGVEDFGAGRSESFWQHYNNGNGGEDESRARFMELWEVLAPLYKAFTENLAERGLSYPGLSYRLALAALAESGTDALPGVRKVVMVGFNALSSVEFHIFKQLLRLRDPEEPSESFGDFYWDCTGAPLADDSNSAVHFMRRNMRIFPSRFPIPQSDGSGLPEVLKCISSPGAAAQAKIASSIIADIRSRAGEKPFDRAKVAVVLPDENLLLPMLYSFPEGMKDVNLTMGYSMKLTSTASFVRLLRKLQQRKRYLQGRLYFFHEDVKMLLSHPFTLMLGEEGEAALLRGRIARSHKYLLEPEDFKGSSDGLRELFVDFGLNPDGFSVGNYIDKSLAAVSAALSAGEQNVQAKLDIAQIAAYRQSLWQLMDSILKYSIEMSTGDVFSLADSLLRGGSVRFEGRPLRGLQVMGPLETRCLDFDYIIILSMNERVYPRKLRKGSFIPASLRRDNGLATEKFQESIFAYNFYRMISRAKEVYMVYDARSEGLKSGDVSRYLLQLEYLYARGRLVKEAPRFTVTDSAGDVSVRKNENVLPALGLYRTDGEEKRYLSASALKDYIKCPLKFYLSDVRQLREDPEPEEFMEAAMVGNVLHGALQMLYTPDPAQRGVLLEKPMAVTPEYISSLLSGEGGEVKAAVRRMINKEYYRLPDEKLDSPVGSEGKVYSDVMESIVRRVLRHDLRFAPFDMLGTEIKLRTRIPLSDGGMVNVKYIIDRLDTAGRDAEGNPCMRIVDYKTGYFNLKFDEVSDLFSPDKGLDALFQLMLYAYLLKHDLKYSLPIAMEIYDLRRIGTPSAAGISQIPVAGGEKVTDYHEFETGFAAQIDAFLCEILSQEGEFAATPSEESCKYCPFKSLCRRQ